MREALFLLPGLLCDAVVWRHQQRALGQRYGIHIPDFRALSSIGAMTDAVLAEAPGRFSVAGHSMGARVALEVAHRAPDRVARLALLDTGIHPVRAGEAEQRRVLTDLSARDGMRALADIWLPPMVREGRLATDPHLRDELYAMVERMTPVVHRNQIQALLDRPDGSVALATIRCPLLVGVGREDRWSPPEQHAAIAAAVPGARYVVFEESGHMAPMEAPEAVTDALSTWMADAVFSPTA